MKYSIKKIASCTFDNAANVGTICFSTYDINSAFKVFNSFNMKSAFEKHGGEHKPCECKYEIIED